MKINSNLSNVHSRTSVKGNFENKVEEKDTFSSTLRKDIRISYYPQDPYVGEPISASIPANGITPGPDNSRIDTEGNVKPDDKGNMIFSPGEAEFVNVQTFVTADKTIKTMEAYLGRKIGWSFGREQIALHPDKGKMMNAYYNKKDGSLNFFHFTDKKTGETIHTGKSYETVAHETGHALLDGLRPGILGWNIETEALHEAFADIVSMLSALQDENNIKKFLEETGGNFSNKNIIAHTGEQFGMSALGQPYIRSAINSFKYKNPYDLPLFPVTGNESELTGEAHNFCRVFTGAFYDLMGETFDFYKARGMSPEDALRKSRDVCGKLLMKGMDRCPPSGVTYKDLAKAMIEADKSFEEGKHKEILLDVFDKRWISFKHEYKGEPEIEVRGNKYLHSTNPEGIMDFVEENRENFLIDSGTVLNLRSIRKNDDGSENFEVAYSLEIPLKGSEYGVFEGAFIDVSGGVTILTDSRGQISSLSNTSVSDSDISNTENTLKHFIKDGRIKFFDPSVKEIRTEDLFDSSGRPYIGYTTYDQGKMKIVPSPIIQ